MSPRKSAIPILLCTSMAWLACAVTLGAESGAPQNWLATQTADRCKLTASLFGPKGEAAGKLEVRWAWEFDDYALDVALSKPTYQRWRFETTDGRTALPYARGNTAYQMSKLEQGEQLARDLEAGRQVQVRFDSGARISTNGASAAQAAGAFSKCIAELKAKPLPVEGARWIVEAQSSRDCVLRVGQLEGVRGLDADFRARRGSPLYFSVGARTPKGGILRIALPGLAQPWLIDTEKYSEPVPPQAETLLAMLERPQPLEMMFTPHGDRPVIVKAPTGGLAAGVRMFRACMAALKKVKPANQPSLDELRYVIEESDVACELTGTFQIQGSGIWITLMSKGKDNVFKIARRMVKPGELATSLDLSALGGPKNLTNEDATFALSATAFASLRRDLAGKGRDFGITMAGGARFAGPFGGPFALLEAPMFDACVRAKNATAPARAGS